MMGGTAKATHVLGFVHQLEVMVYAAAASLCRPTIDSQACIVKCAAGADLLIPVQFWAALVCRSIDWIRVVD